MNSGNRTGQIIRLRRQEMGLTMKQLAERVGISVGYLSDVEKGARRLTAARVDQLEEILGVSGLDASRCLHCRGTGRVK